MLDDVKDPRRSHYIFKILLTGVEPAYQIAHPGEKDHTNVDRAAWISTFEEALAKTIVHIVLLRQAEQTSQAEAPQKNRIWGLSSKSTLRVDLSPSISNRHWAPRRKQSAQKSSTNAPELVEQGRGEEPADFCVPYQY